MSSNEILEKGLSLLKSVQKIHDDVFSMTMYFPAGGTTPK